MQAVINRPIISVIMLTYNRENMLSRMVECMLSQTFTDFEYLIIDNGSTDHSGKIADEYAVKDSRIRVIHREHGSIGSGRNTGLDEAVGEWIAFVDDDDTCEADFLEFLYNLAALENADISICGADKVENGVVVEMPCFDKVVMDSQKALVELLWRKRYNNGFPTKLFNRKLFEKLRFPGEGRYDDIYLMYRIIAEAGTVVSHCLPKYRAWRHDSNNSIATTKDGMITPEYLSDYRTAYRERTKWLAAHYNDLKEMWWYFDWSFLISMINKIITNNLTDCRQHLDEMRDELRGHQEEFVNCIWAQDFEKEWMRKYIPD